MLEVLKCLKSTPSIVPPEIRDLQLAVAASLDDIAIADDRWIYYTSLTIAKRLHEQGVRLLVA